MEDNPPYFFTETLAVREQLTERQRARAFTLEDLDWLDAVYSATHAARMAHKPPMQVESLHLTTPGKPSIELAGAFMMRPAPGGGAFLYTPCRGLERFDSVASVKSTMSTWLEVSEQREALFRYLSLSQRAALSTNETLTLTTVSVAGAVFEEQQRALQNNLRNNAQGMLEELYSAPSLTSMLEQAINTALAAHFPGLNQRDTRVSCHIAETSQTTTRSLSETVLAYFVDNSWPAGETRQYSNLGRAPDPQQSNRAADDQLHWERSVQTLAQGLMEQIKTQLSLFWQAASRAGPSRLDYFAAAMSDRFRVSLLDQQQQANISTDQSLEIQTRLLTSDALSSDSASALRVEKVLLGESDVSFVELAGALMIRPIESETDAQAILYTPSEGVLADSDVEELKTRLQERVNSPKQPDDWKNYLSRPQRYFDISFSTSTVITSPLTGAVFPGLMRTVIEKQAQNLEYGLEMYRQSKGTMDIDALIDHLLDVRAMIDPALRGLDAKGRWSTQLAASWYPSADLPQGGESALQTVRTELRELESLHTELEGRLATRPTLYRSAIAQLNSELSSTEEAFRDAANIFINTYSSPPGDTERRTPVSSVNMVDHFLARFCGESEVLTPSPNSGFFSVASEGVAKKVPDLELPAFNTIIETSLKGFKGHLRLVDQRVPDLRLLLEKAMTIGLKAEAKLRVLDNSLRPSDRAIILTVLDSYKRDTRRSMNAFRPDALSLTLTTAERDVSAVLSNCFVLTERGGQDPEYSGKTILWSPALGLEVFSSLAALRTTLNQRLLEPEERIALLENLPRSERLLHQIYTVGSFELIEDGLVAYLHRHYEQQRKAEITHLLSPKLPAQYLQDIWQVQITQTLAPTNVERSTAIAQALILRHSLPEWVANAPVADQQLQVELLEQYRNSVEADKDYLHGIDSLADFTRNKLSTLLRTLDNQSRVTPDQIEVTVPAHRSAVEKTLTLVDYATSHRDEWGTEAPRFTSTGSALLSRQLDAKTLTTHIQALNISGTYQDYLRGLFTAANPDLLERQQRFARQLPWQLMQHAHAQFLAKQMTATAFGYIQQIMDMPDSIARAAVTGANATIRPLELLTSIGATAVKAVGIYVISPASGQGPHVLYAPYSQGHCLKEYADEASLLTELWSLGPLQSWVLRLLPQAAQSAITTFFNPNNASRSSLQLASNPIVGCLFKQLFADNFELLLKLLGCHSISNAVAYWNLAKSVFSSGIYQGIPFLAAKLEYPLLVWQSYKLFKASADALQDHHWRTAISQFVSGVAQMALLRRSMPEISEQTLPVQPDAITSEAVATWPAIDITAPERTRLQPHEVTDLALQEMTRVGDLGLYQSAQKRHYAPVEGKVFQVKQQGEHWRIFSSLGDGPLIRKNTRQQWMLSSQVPLLHARRALAKLSNQFYSCPLAREGMNIEASGMEAIRTLYPKRGLMITEALAMATYYTKNAQENLRLVAATLQASTPTLAVIKETFDLQVVEMKHIEKIQSVVDKVFNALTAPSLNTLNSERFVVGVSRGTPPPGNTAVMAFVVVPDADQVIYLTQEFFKPTLEYKPFLTKPFYVNVHARAIALIHELSHHVCATEDIARLDASHPFLDLIRNDTPDNRAFKARLKQRQTERLCLFTPFTELFQIVKNVDPQDSLLQHILSVTGGDALDDARRIFRSDPLKRMDTILSNADSVALLISRLGRQLDLSPSAGESGYSVDDASMKKGPVRRTAS